MLEIEDLDIYLGLSNFNSEESDTYSNRTSESSTDRYFKLQSDVIFIDKKELF